MWNKSASAIVPGCWAGFFQFLLYICKCCSWDLRKGFHHNSIQLLWSMKRRENAKCTQTIESSPVQSTGAGSPSSRFGKITTIVVPLRMVDLAIHDPSIPAHRQACGHKGQEKLSIILFPSPRDQDFDHLNQYLHHPHPPLQQNIAENDQA